MEKNIEEQVQTLVENAQQIYDDLNSLRKDIPLAETVVKQNQDLSAGPALLGQMQDIRDELGLGAPSETVKVPPPGNPNNCHWCTASGGV
ncbi:MAG: hypothetical protein Q7J10_06510 [Methanosarcinaceae archaeon]|nr:hypothetical protein [Methanosarcinaceae archaeon]